MKVSEGMDLGSLAKRLRSDKDACSSASLYEAAGQQGAFPSAIKPVAAEKRLCGTGLPVLVAPGDNLRIHHAIYAARPGDVLVVSTHGSYDHGYCGEILAHAAQERRLAGIVVDGCVRDAERLRRLPLSIFARGFSIRGTAKNAQSPGCIGAPVTIGEVCVLSGDLIFGDEDGLILLPRATAGRIVGLAEERERFEQNVIAALHKGARTVDIYKLPEIP